MVFVGECLLRLWYSRRINQSTVHILHFCSLMEKGRATGTLTAEMFWNCEKILIVENYFLSLWKEPWSIMTISSYLAYLHPINDDFHYNSSYRGEFLDIYGNLSCWQNVSAEGLKLSPCLFLFFSFQFKVCFLAPNNSVFVWPSFLPKSNFLSSMQIIW